MSYNHVLFFSDKESDGSYHQIFLEKPPEKVLVFRPRGFTDLPSGLAEAAGEARIIVHEVESLSIDDENEWFANEVQIKPHRVLMDMFEGLRESNLDHENIVISIFSGSKLHAALQLTFAMIIDADIQIIQGEPGREQEIVCLDWLKGALHSIETQKLQQGVLLGMLEAKWSEYSKFLTFSDSQYSYSPESDGWLEAETIVGSQPEETVPDTKGFSATASAMCNSNLIARYLEPSAENREQRYRLTGKGWMAALSLWNERKEGQTESRSGRISGVMINPNNPKLSAVGILNTLERVDRWITLFGTHHEGSSAGICLSSPSSVAVHDLDSETTERFKNALETWNHTLVQQEVEHAHWALYDAGQDVEEDFTILCEWLWPRLEAMRTPSTTWSVDLTQLLNSTQLIPAVLFAQSAGLPMTYCLRRSGGQGPSGRDVTPSQVSIRSHVLSMPNRDFLPVFMENQSSKLLLKHRTLLALLHHDRVRQRQIESAKVSLRDDPFGEIPEHLRPMDCYLTYSELSKFIDDEILAQSLTEDFSLPSKPNAKSRQYLRAARLITSRQKSGQGSAEAMMLSPIGKLLALYIETKVSASQGGN